MLMMLWDHVYTIPSALLGYKRAIVICFELSSCSLAPELFPLMIKEKESAATGFLSCGYVASQ